MTIIEKKSIRTPVLCPFTTNWTPLPSGHHPVIKKPSVGISKAALFRTKHASAKQKLLCENDLFWKRVVKATETSIESECGNAEILNPTAFITSHDIKNSGKTSEEVQDFFKAEGFHLRILDNHHGIGVCLYPLKINLPSTHD